MQWNSGLHRVGLHLRQHHQHARGRHPRGGLPRGADHAGQQVRARAGSSRRRTTNLTGDDIREGLTAIVSVKLGEPQFEGQTKTKLGNTEAKSLRAEGRQRPARRLVRAATRARARRSPARRSQAATRAHRGAQGARPRPRPQGLLESGGLPGKLADCQSTDPERVRALHRRGRLGRRLGQGRPRPEVPGDPADPRQDPQRREGAHRPGAAEQRGAGADHRARHRHPRRLRRRRSCAITRSS